MNMFRGIGSFCVSLLMASSLQAGVFDSYMQESCESSNDPCFNSSCCCQSSSSFYIGGGYSYTKSSYPQYFLQDVYYIEERNPIIIGDLDRVGYTRKLNNNGWTVYGGYRYSLDCNWDVGLEVGYHDAGRITNRCGPFDKNEYEQIHPYRKINTYFWDILFTARYNFCNGLNLFAKVGPAFIYSKIKEGQFLAESNPEFSNVGIFANRTYRLSNIYPEVVVGFGYKPIHFANIVVSYSHIFGKSSPNSYNTFTSVGTRPSNCASIDAVSIAVEFSYDQLPF